MKTVEQTNEMCSRLCSPNVEVICKQRSAGPRELDRTVYVFIRIEAIDPELATLWDVDRDSSTHEVLSGPFRLDATPDVRDHDTGAFRVAAQIPIRLVCSPGSNKQYAKFEVNVVAKFEPTPPKTFRTAEKRRIVIAGTLCEGAGLSKDVHNDKARSRVSSLLARLQSELPNHVDAGIQAQCEREVDEIMSSIQTMRKDAIESIEGSLQDPSLTHLQKLERVRELLA